MLIDQRENNKKHQHQFIDQLKMRWVKKVGVHKVKKFKSFFL